MQVDKNPSIQFCLRQNHLRLRQGYDAQAGFTIIEWLASFFIILFTLTLIFQFMVVVNARLAEISQLNDVCATNSIALDNIAKSIGQAPSAKNKWKKISKTEIAWHDNRSQLNIGWKIEKENIFFLSGTYENGSWKKKRRSLVAENINKLEFFPVFDRDRVKLIKILIEFMFKNKTHNFERVAFLKNRVI